MTTLLSAFDPTARGCFVIGEIGVNHNGDLAMARQLIDVAADAGADAVKFQTFSAEKLVTRTARQADYQARNLGSAEGESQFAMLQALELSADELRACHAHCRERGVLFLSTPFDEDAADLLEAVGVEGFKVGSGDLTHLPMLAHIAQKGLPMIVSTGMANLGEVERAVRTVEAAGDPPLAILHCVSDYPAEAADCNLAAMNTLAQAFGRVVGWSDHTLGDAVSVAAVARGARILEKHFTLDTNLPGPDHKASLPPAAFKDLVAKVRQVEAAIGDGIKRPRASERATARVARRSVVSARAVARGETLREADLAIKRPGTGFAPDRLSEIVGRRAARDIAADTVLAPADLGEVVLGEIADSP